MDRLSLSNVQKWDSSTTMKFLKLYHKHGCLWNINNPGYKDRNARAAAHEEIAKTMNLRNFDSRYVALKIRVLRTTYMEERRKIQRRSSETGISSTQLDWFYFADSFLKNNIIKKKKPKIRQLRRLSSVNNNENTMCDFKSDNVHNHTHVADLESLNIKPEILDDSDKSIGQIDYHVPDLVYQNDGDESPLLADDDDGDHQIFSYPEVNQQLEEPQQRRPSSCSKQSTTNHMHHQQQQMQLMGGECGGGGGGSSKRPRFDDSNCSVVPDEFETFGKSVAAQLKAIPLHRAYELELKIQYLLTNAKLETLGKSAADVLNAQFY